MRPNETGCVSDQQCQRACVTTRCDKNQSPSRCLCTEDTHLLFDRCCLYWQPILKVIRDQKSELPLRFRLEKDNTTNVSRRFTRKFFSWQTKKSCKDSLVRKTIIMTCEKNFYFKLQWKFSCKIMTLVLKGRTVRVSLSEYRTETPMATTSVAWKILHPWGLNCSIEGLGGLWKIFFVNQLFWCFGCVSVASANNRKREGE